MKHIQLFEGFKNKLTSLEGAPQQKTCLIKITIEFECRNPDAKYGATVEGVGNIPSEAALMALAAGWKYCLEGVEKPSEVLSSEEAFKILDEVYTTPANYEKDITDLVMNRLDPNVFGDHGTVCNATSTVETVQNRPIGGFIVSGHFNDYNSGKSGKF